MQPVALENTRHLHLIFNTKMLVGLSLLTLFLVTYFWLVLRASKTDKFAKRIVYAIALLLIAGILRNDDKLLGSEQLAQRDKLYANYANSFLAKSPYSEFAKSIAAAFADQSKLEGEIGDLNRLSEDQYDFVLKHEISWAEKDAWAPLFRSITTSDMDGLESRAFSTPPNLIVIFAEGISTRTIQPYSDRFPGITPTISEFSKHAIRFDNYYNHTFATYRALAGQHCSNFPNLAIEPATRYRCLGHLLQDSGYSTHFLFSQWSDATEVDEVLSSVGIQDVIAYDQILERKLASKDKKDSVFLSDQRLFDALVSQLKHLEQQKQPFYVGLYNFETHTGIKLKEHTSSYPSEQYTEAADYILDGINNLDSSFATFWNYFQNSTLSENTIVVFTSDHARFPDQHFRSFWEDDPTYMPFFMDEIPLLIYSPFHKKVRPFKNSYSSSLDFAPTMLHLLGINRYESAFLGDSILHVKKRFPPLATARASMWYLKGNVLHRLTDEETNPNYARMQTFIRKTQELEIGDRLLPVDIGSAAQQADTRDAESDTQPVAE